MIDSALNELNSLQFINAFAPILEIGESHTKEFNCEHFSKAESPILGLPLIVTSFNNPQLEKAVLPIVTSGFSKETFSILVLESAACPNVSTDSKLIDCNDDTL